jgi:hypothetical protein
MARWNRDLKSNNHHGDTEIRRRHGETLQEWKSKSNTKNKVNPKPHHRGHREILEGPRRMQNSEGEAIKFAWKRFAGYPDESVQMTREPDNPMPRL